jgi:hypothetical protein
MVPLSIFIFLRYSKNWSPGHNSVLYPPIEFHPESGLLFQNRQNFVVDEGSEVTCLSQFGGLLQLENLEWRPSTTRHCLNFDRTPGAQYIRVLCECLRVPTTPTLQFGLKVGWR